MPDPHPQLRAALGAEPPEGVAALDEAVQADLADLVRSARAQQARTLQEAFDRTLKVVPFPARKIVKKVLLG